MAKTVMSDYTYKVFCSGTWEWHFCLIRMAMGRIDAFDLEGQYWYPYDISLTKHCLQHLLTATSLTDAVSYIIENCNQPFLGPEVQELWVESL